MTEARQMEHGPARHSEAGMAVLGSTVRHLGYSEA